MDSYTLETQRWLDKLYRRVDDGGVYVAHQPIYGFRAGHCSDWLFDRYVRTLETMRGLARLNFASLADIGASEGYKAALAQRLFGCDVVAADLSSEACRRAEEIYGLRAREADVQALPFDDGEFDVVLCSETLEHVPDFRAGVRELIRVARGAVLITVPHEPPGVVERNREVQKPHGHIQSLNSSSLDWLREEGDFQIDVQRLVHPLPLALSAFAEGTRKVLREPPDEHRAENVAVEIYNRVGPLTARVLGPRTQGALMELDRWACTRATRHRAMQFVITMDEEVMRPTPRREVAPRDVIGFTVPLHRL